MVWSVSTAKMFDRCQRQWFYKTHFASARSNDPLRRTAYLLGKLQSVSSWRGSLVDQILSTEIIPALERDAMPSQERVQRLAMERFDRQLAAARQHRLHEPGFWPTGQGADFAAFYAIEYGDGPSDAELEEARHDVQTAIANFFALEKLIGRLGAAERLLTQRRLLFAHSDTKVSAVPDVIVFSNKTPPAIVDWKVHTFGWHDAWLQLAVYAAALTRTQTQAGFPKATNGYKPTEIGLLEVQLLTNVLRKHVLSDDDIERADAFIARSAEAMLLALGTTDVKAAVPSQFPAARYANTCETCSYRRLCWDDAHA